MGSFKDTICSQEAKGTCTCLLDIKVQYQETVSVQLYRNMLSKRLFFHLGFKLNEKHLKCLKRS